MRLGRLAGGRGGRPFVQSIFEPGPLDRPAAERALICRLASWSLGLSFLTCSQQAMAFCQLSLAS